MKMKFDKEAIVRSMERALTHIDNANELCAPEDAEKRHEEWERCRRTLYHLFAASPLDEIENQIFSSDFREDSIPDILYMLNFLDIYRQVDINSPIQRFYQKVAVRYIGIKHPDFEKNFKKIFQKDFPSHLIGYVPDSEGEFLLYMSNDFAEALGMTEREFLLRSLELPGVRHQIAV